MLTQVACERCPVVKDRGGKKRTKHNWRFVCWKTCKARNCAWIKPCTGVLGVHNALILGNKRYLHYRYRFSAESAHKDSWESNHSRISTCACGYLCTLDGASMYNGWEATRSKESSERTLSCRPTVQVRDRAKRSHTAPNHRANRGADTSRGQHHPQQNRASAICTTVKMPRMLAIPWTCKYN